MVISIMRDDILEMDTIFFWNYFCVIIFLYLLLPLLIRLLLIIDFDGLFSLIFFHPLEFTYKHFDDLILWIGLFKNNITNLHEEFASGLLWVSYTLVNYVAISIQLGLLFGIFPLFPLDRFLLITHILQVLLKSYGKFHKESISILQVREVNA